MEPKTPSRKHLIIGLLGFLWFLGIILSYFVSHKPIDVTTAASLGQTLWRLIVCSLFFALAGGTGTFILKRLNWQPDLHPLTKIALLSSLGLGTLGLLIFITGALIGLPAWYIWLSILMLLGILLRKDILTWVRYFGTVRTLWRNSNPVGKAIGLLLLMMMVFTLTIALAPPVYFDSLVSHLVMPQAYLSEGHISYLPWLFMSGMPQIVEVLYLPLMSLADAEAAALLCWMTSFISIVGLLGYLSKRFSTNAAWVSQAALLSGYSIIMLTTNAYVEWFSLLFGFCALLFMDLWRQNQDRITIIFSGIFIGFTVGTKYTAGVLAVALTATLAWHCWQSKRKFIPAFFSLALPALIVFSPWLLKNLLTTANPVYPLIFPSGAMTPLRLEAYQNIPPWGNWQDIFILPFRATYMGFDKASGYGMDIGPLLLALGALSWISARQRPENQRASVQNAAVTAIAGVVIWAAGNQGSSPLLQTRYYFALFPAFVILAAAGYDGLASMKIPSVRLERLMLALILLVLVLSLLHISTDTLTSGAPQTVLGLQTEDEYLTRNLGWYYPVMQHLNDLPEGFHTLLFFEPRGFYCGERCKPDEIMDRWKRDWIAYQDIGAIKAAWKAEGFTHFLYYQSGATLMRDTKAIQYTPEDWQALDDFLASFDDPVNFDDIYLLFEIN